MRKKEQLATILLLKNEGIIHDLREKNKFTAYRPD